MRLGKYNPREGWRVVWLRSGAEAVLFVGDAGDAVMAYDDALRDDRRGGQLRLETPGGHALSVAVFPG